MRNRWRAEEDPRERYPPHHRPRDRDIDWERQGRRPHSPYSAHRGGARFASHREGDWADRNRREPYRKRQFSRDRDSTKFDGRKPPSSPSRASNPNYHHQSSREQIEERLSRRREHSPARSAKRRRTQSPSPAGSARFGFENQRPGRSRGSPDFDDRRPSGPRSRSPPRNLLPHPSRPGSPTARSQVSDRGTRGQREPSPSLNRDRRSLSPRPNLRSSPPRRPVSKHSTLDTPISSVNSIPIKSRLPLSEGQPSAKDNPPSKTPSVIDETDNRSMDGQYPPHRGNYGMHRGQQRPFVDTRQQYGGSPPYSSNSSYHGSPQAHSPYHNQRGDWGGQGQVCI